MEKMEQFKAKIDATIKEQNIEQAIKSVHPLSTDFKSNMKLWLRFDDGMF